MIIIVYVFILFFCISGIYLKPRNNYLQYIVIGLIGYLMGRGALTPDTYNYLARYTGAANLSFSDVYEPGYLLLMKVGIWIGLDYVQFRTATILMALLLINQVANRISDKNIYFFYLFYCLFLIFIDTEQLRSFLAFSLVVYALGQLILFKKYSGSIYSFFVLLAATIHISSLAYIILLLLRLKEREALAWTISFFVLSICFVIYINGNKLDFMEDILRYISGGDERISGYITGQVNLGFLYAFVLQFATISCLWIAKVNIDKECRFLIQNNIMSDEALFAKKVIGVVMSLNLLMIAFFPFYMFNMQFIRLERSMFIITLMSMSTLFFRYRFVKYQQVSVFCLVCMLNLFWFYFTFIVGDHIEDIVIPFFDADTVATDFQ